VGEHVGGPLHTELRRLENEVALGVPRSHAYRALATRIGSDDVSRAMAALRRADQLGVPVADALRRQADDFRRARELRARERAATAGPKIQLIVALLMVPSTLFLVIGLLLIQLTRQINAVIGL
jgi:tight adherence protein C